MDAGEYHHPLLNQRHCRADRLIGVLVAQLLKAGLHNALAGVHQEAQQLKQRGARRIERHRHGELTHVINQRAALHLHHFSRLKVNGLAARAALEFQQGGDVLDVGAVQQSPQRARGGARKAANHVR